MKVNKKVIIAAILWLICLLIHFYSLNEIRIETGYSSHFSPSFSRFLRKCLGGLPFSIGDFLYGLLAFWISWSCIKFFRQIFRRDRELKRTVYLFHAMLRLFIFCSSMYIIFNIFWGINYNRKGIAWQLRLDMKKYRQSDLEEINCLLIEKINLSKKTLTVYQIRYPSNKVLYGMVCAAFKNASGQYPFLAYQPSSLKTSMWGWLGNYTGFTGYYNPFTGEAQLNTTVPKFLHPFIACHEVAHQLGYAKEMEANFVGYLAASASSDPGFRYSVYLDLFTYANRNLFLQDSATAKLYRRELDTAVIADLKEWARFNRKHQSPVEPVVRWIYGKYLEGNSQPQGLLSYDEVTAFIISYYKKFGKI